MIHEHRLHADAFEEWLKSIPSCIGTCDGDLPGEEHDEDCPMSKVLDSSGCYLAANLRSAFDAGRAPADAALADISARKAVLIEAYGFTEQTETEGATEIDDGWDAATMRGYGEWAAIISLEDILKGER